MSYRTNVTDPNLLDPTTPVVLIANPATLQDIRAVNPTWTFAQRVGSSTSFYLRTNCADSPPGVTPPNITFRAVDTINFAIVGAQVLINVDIPGGNTWRVGTVTSDGTNITPATGSGVSGQIPLTAFACAVVNLIGYFPPTGPTAVSGEVFSLLGTSAGMGGPGWFGNSRIPSFYGTALTNVGGISPGSLALVNTAPNKWQIMTV